MVGRNARTLVAGIVSMLSLSVLVVQVSSEQALAVAPSINLSNDTPGASTGLTVEYTLGRQVLSGRNILYLNRPSAYPSFTPVSGATFASIITFWLNGVQQPVATYLNPNAIWAGGIQIWSRVTMNVGDTVKFQFSSGYITNPAAGQTVTWAWRTAEGSGAAIESFSTTATVAGGATTTTSTTIPADTTAPTLSSRTPSDGATGVSRTANLVLGFSENVSAVAGKSVSIMDSDSNSAVETISVTDSSLVTVSGSTVTVNPSSTLDYGTDYFVRVDAGAFRDAAGNAFAGVWDSTLWNFATLTDPTATTTTSSSTSIPSATVTTIATPVLPQASAPTSGQVDSGSPGSQSTTPVTPSEAPPQTSLGAATGMSTTTVAGAGTGTATVPRIPVTTSPSVSISTTTTIPDVPVVPGDFVTESSARVAYVGGRATEVTVSVESNKVISTFGDVTIAARAVKANGEPVLVNPDGSIPVREGDNVVVEAEGFAPDSTVDVWMFSDPVFLGSVAVAADGRLTFNGTIPDVPTGSHNLIFDGQVAAGDVVQVAKPLLVLEDLGGTSIVRRVGTTAVWALLVVALLSGFVIPNRTRRRRID